jgi:hypothetical protein
VLLLINNRPARFWDISGQTDGTLPLALEAGYHNLTLLLQPPCTRQIDPAFQCRELAYSFEGSVASQELRGGTTYTDGIILRWADLRQSDDTLDVRLYWLLNEARDTRDVRFVHVVDAGGQVVAQRDTPSGQLDASSIYPEIVSLPLADIPPGRYSVRVGWYQLADDGSYRNYLSDGQAFYMLGTFVRDEE